MIYALTLIIALTAPTLSPPDHGGGCRKDSPTGQCCHKQKSTGNVHCHDLNPD